MKRWTLFTAAALAIAVTTWVARRLDEKQRGWIFQPSDRSWAGTAESAHDMDDVWVEFKSQVTGEPAKLHGLWLASKERAADGPVMLYLHGARWNVEGSSPRIRRMQELGFSVLAIDYRGFGKSTPGLPSEEMAYEDARAAWDWLAANTRNALATSSAIRWAGPWRSTWPPRSTMRAAPSSKARSPRSPTWPAPWHGAGCRWDP